jgi:hypothetical protein
VAVLDDDEYPDPNWLTELALWLVVLPLVDYYRY